MLIDVVSASVFHPSGSIIATSSGQRKYELSLDVGDSDSDSHSEQDLDQKVKRNDNKRTEGDESLSSDRHYLEISESTVIDNSICLWSLPGQYAWYVNGVKWTESMAHDTAADQDLNQGIGGIGDGSHGIIHENEDG
jgi:hypothetical protein